MEETRETCKAVMLDYLNMFQGVQYEIAVSGKYGASVFNGEDTVSILIDDADRCVCSCNLHAGFGDDENKKRYSAFKERLKTLTNKE